MPSLKLIYFGFPGRAECSRLMLQHAGVQYEEQTVNRGPEWDELKKTLPFGQVPVLVVDGKMLAQTNAVERYVANLTGMYPTDAWEAAKADELVAFNEEILQLFIPTWSIPDEAEKIKKRQEVIAGPLKTKFEKLTSLLEAAGNEFFMGNKPTWPDFAVFSLLSMLVCGLLDGVPATLYDSYPALKAFHGRIASLPAVAKFYENVTEGTRLHYKSLP